MEFFLLLIALAVGAFVLWPALVGPRSHWVFSEDDTPIGRLAVRKEVLVGNLADLDFEFAMGKLSEDDYRSIRESLKRQTLRVMEQLDVLVQSETAMDGGKGAKAGTAQATAAFCSSCGGNLPPRASFCPHCGARV